MTLQTAGRAIRRSSLDIVHAALGARWISDLERFPTDYGSPDEERVAVLASGGLAELGPTRKLLVTSDRAAASIREAGLPVESSRVASSEDTEVWSLAQDEVLVVTVNDSADLPSRIQAGGAAVTDVSSGWTTLRIAGPAVPAILEQACAVDLAVGTVAEGRIIQAQVANVRAILVRRDLPALPGESRQVPGFTMLVARDEAEYLWGALLQLGRGQGLAPVGMRAVEGGRS